MALTGSDKYATLLASLAATLLVLTVYLPSFLELALSRHGFAMLCTGFAAWVVFGTWAWRKV